MGNVTTRFERNQFSFLLLVPIVALDQNTFFYLPRETLDLVSDTTCFARCRALSCLRYLFRDVEDPSARSTLDCPAL
jgi:hypothetical protein